jgi:hypothetical protein
MSISLDLTAQKRLAARIAMRERGGQRHPALRDEIAKLAASGWAPSVIGEMFGRSERWAAEKLRQP